MKVLHLSTYDLAGGAARAVRRLHKELYRLGVDSSMLVCESRSGDSTVHTFEPTMRLLGRLRRRLRRAQIARSLAPYQDVVPAGYEPFRTERSEYGADLVLQLLPCDLINLHWIVNFVDYESFFATVPQTRPLVWTLHDMNAFTGGCHYDLGCGRYVSHCGECPQLASSTAEDLSYQIWERKQKIFARVDPSRLHIVTPSRWLADEVHRSPILGRFPISVIPYGLDLEDFAPRDRRSARDLLGVPQGAKVVLFVADGLETSRKGFSILAQTLMNYDAQPSDLFLLSLGHNKPSVDFRIPWLHLGFMNNDRLLSLAYSAADVFVIPSLQDNLPNTVLESMACGTPVVGFAVGGIPDMVQPGVTGMLVPPRDTVGLLAAILSLIHDEKTRREMSSNCRRIAVEEYSLELQARRYSELYKSLL